MEQKITFHRFSNSGERYYSHINPPKKNALKLFNDWKAICKKKEIPLILPDEIKKLLSNFHAYTKDVLKIENKRFTYELTSKITSLEMNENIKYKYSEIVDDYFEFEREIVEEKVILKEARFDFEDIIRAIKTINFEVIDFDSDFIDRKFSFIHIDHKFSQKKINGNLKVFDELKAKYLMIIFKKINENFALNKISTYNKLVANLPYEKKFDNDTFIKCFSERGVVYHDRIEKADTDTINDAILMMNKVGWSVKQIQGIESGKSYYEIQKGELEKGGSGAGAGYSFTEGIMILWEKN